MIELKSRRAAGCTDWELTELAWPYWHWLSDIGYADTATGQVGNEHPHGAEAEVQAPILDDEGDSPSGELSARQLAGLVQDFQCFVRRVWEGTTDSLTAPLTLYYALLTTWLTTDSLTHWLTSRTFVTVHSPHSNLMFFTYLPTHCTHWGTCSCLIGGYSGSIPWFFLSPYTSEIIPPLLPHKQSIVLGTRDYVKCNQVQSTSLLCISFLPGITVTYLLSLLLLCNIK